ncbi:MAG: hypothetical protein M5T61_03295 [Acidimicrobiia bacterium]|nr:hypothetical protein [Acidimicrobiia bacterium]
MSDDEIIAAANERCPVMEQPPIPWWAGSWRRAAAQHDHGDWAVRELDELVKNTEKDDKGALRISAGRDGSE